MRVARSADIMSLGGRRSNERCRYLMTLTSKRWTQRRPHARGQVSRHMGLGRGRSKERYIILMNLTSNVGPSVDPMRVAWSADIMGLGARASYGCIRRHGEGAAVGLWQTWQCGEQSRVKSVPGHAYTSDILRVVANSSAHLSSRNPSLLLCSLLDWVHRALLTPRMFKSGVSYPHAVYPGVSYPHAVYSVLTRGHPFRHAEPYARAGGPNPHWHARDKPGGPRIARPRL